MQQTVPQLDSSLAAPCKTLVAPQLLDFDDWQVWTQDVVLQAYGDCAARHLKTVQAWPQATVAKQK